MNQMETIMQNDKSVCMFGCGIDCFAEEGSDGQNVRLKLYDGEVHKHWYWGNLAFDLESARVAKKRTPLLIDHDTGIRAGVGTDFSNENGLYLTGRFLKSSPAAQEVRQQAAEGYPFEASLRFNPNKSKIVSVPKGKTHRVNGHTLEGPGTVFYNTQIVEASIVTFGALSNCETQIFQDKMKGQNMSEQTEMTLDTLKTSHKDLFDKVFSDGVAEGEKRERDLYGAIFKVCPDPALAVKCWKEGKDKHEAEVIFKDSEIASLKKQLEKKSDPDAGAKQEFSDKPKEKEELKDTRELHEMSDEELTKFYNADKALRDEFRSPGTYIAFLRADAKGLIKINERT